MQSSAHWATRILTFSHSLWYNPLALPRQLNVPPVSYTILLSSPYNLNTAGAAWHHVGKTDRYVLFEIPVKVLCWTLPSSLFHGWAIMHVKCVCVCMCVFNPLKHTLGLYYTTSCLPKYFALQFLCHYSDAIVVVCGGPGGLGDVGCALELQIGSPHPVSSTEVIDMQITWGVCACISRQSCISALCQ